MPDSIPIYNLDNLGSEYHEAVSALKELIKTKNQKGLENFIAGKKVALYKAKKTTKKDIKLILDIAKETLNNIKNPPNKNLRNLEMPFTELEGKTFSNTDSDWNNGMLFAPREITKTILLNMDSDITTQIKEAFFNEHSSDRDYITILKAYMKKHSLVVTVEYNSDMI